jgi:hypothetical protein
VAVQGHWAYLNRAIDGDGQLVDVMLSEQRDLDAARAFFESPRGVVGPRPKQVSTDGPHPTHGRSRRRWGNGEHRSICGLGHPIEQDHRGIQPRYYPTLGFTVFKTAAGFCRVGRSAELFSTPAEDGARDLLGEETAAVHWTIPEVARSILWGMTHFCTGLPSLSNSGPSSEKPSSDRFLPIQP